MGCFLRDCRRSFTTGVACQSSAGPLVHHPITVGGRTKQFRAVLSRMSSTETPTSGAANRTDRADERPVPEVVDWVLGALFVLVGLASAVAGAAIIAAIDRSAIREAVAEEEIQSDVLTDAEVVDVAQATMTWSGVGLLVVGALLVLGGIAYALLRRRTHRRAAAGEEVSHYGGNATLGAVAAIVFSFVPFSQALGGLLAGALEGGSDKRALGVGALSGVLAVVPLLVVLAFALVGVTIGLFGVGEGAWALVVAAGLLLTLGVLVTIGAGLGALGGFLGGRLAGERFGGDDDAGASSVE